MSVRQGVPEIAPSLPRLICLERLPLCLSLRPKRSALRAPQGIGPARAEGKNEAPTATTNPWGKEPEAERGNTKNQ
jgi:hypothetical protein